MSLADDSGLVVPSLGGIPGIHSARYALNPYTDERDFKYAMGKLNLELGEKDRSAYFACALSMAWPDGHVETFEGKVHGTLVWPLRGENGFGYVIPTQANKGGKGQHHQGKLFRCAKNKGNVS